MSTCTLTGNTYSYFPLCWNVMNHRAVWQDKCTKTKLFDQAKSDCELSWPDVVLELLEPQDSESHGDQEPELKSLTVTHTRGVTMGEKTHPHTHPETSAYAAVYVCVFVRISSGRWDWTGPVNTDEVRDERRAASLNQDKACCKSFVFFAFLRMDPNTFCGVRETKHTNKLHKHNVRYTKTIFSGLFKDFHDLHIKDINRDTIQCWNN